MYLLGVSGLSKSSRVRLFSAAGADVTNSRAPFEIEVGDNVLIYFL